jgi:hypothetical protein
VVPVTFVAGPTLTPGSRGEVVLASAAAGTRALTPMASVAATAAIFVKFFMSCSLEVVI